MRRSQVQAEALYAAFAKQAKAKQVEAGGDKKSEDFQKSVTQKIEQPIEPAPRPNERKVAAKVAQTFGT